MKPTIIPIIKGDDTNWNDVQSFIINIDTSKIPDLDLSNGYRAEFKLGSIIKCFDTIENNRIQPVLTHKDTSSLPLGHIDGSIKIIDSENRVKTFKSDIHFQVKSGVFCWKDPCEVDIYITTGSYDKLSDKPTINGVELKGNLSSDDLDIASKEDLSKLSNLISEKTSIEEVKEILDIEISGLAEVAKTGSYNDLKDKPVIPPAFELNPASSNELGGIKVGKGLSIKEDGTLSVIGGEGGTSDYEELINKPSINNVELIGDKTLEELGVQPKGEYAEKSSVEVLNNEVNIIKDQLSNTLVFEEI
ncbi:MAG: hypothetical protein NC222_06070 [Staphylococcus sp.]|nr:hypothetical protein [Staphylococcus sp.]